MASDFETTTSNRQLERVWTFFGIVCFILVLGGFLVFVSMYWGNRSPKLDSELILGIVATTAVLILASTYFYAYRFFLDVFFLFIAIGWFANAFYLPFEFFISSEAKNLQFEISVYYLSFLLHFPFFLSLFVPGNDKESHWRFIQPFFGWLLGLLIGSFLFHYVAQTFVISDSWKFSVLTIPGVVFVMYIYFSVGHKLRGLFGTDLYGKTGKALAFTFYGYAAIQVTYPFKLFLRSTPVGAKLLFAVFVIALALKIGNNLSLLGVLLSTVTYPRLLSTQERLTDMEERLQRRSQLEELGALASSIEHDLKTPLGTMMLTISTMRRRFQAHPGVLEGLNKLDDARKRMAAIARVVPFLRGDKAFFDRDRFMDKVNVLESIHRAVRAVKAELKLDSERVLIKVDGRDVFVRAYAPMLEQVIVNIIKNGVEAIEEAKRTHGVIRIRSGTMRDEEHDRYDKWAKIDITDNGCGIPESDIPKVTTLFTTRSDLKPNSGIGMFIGARIMRIHNGTVNIESVVGKETTVSLLLPEWGAYLKSISKGDPDGAREGEDDETLDDTEG